MSKRIRYFLCHLLISLILAVLTTILVTQIWYPAPLFSATGLAKIFFMLLTIDVLIGPLFSLLVYKEYKKSLKFDLAIILLIQSSAFAYGLYSISQGRPAWIVFNKDRFDLVRINEIDTRNLDKAPQIYQSAPLLGAEWVEVDVERQSIEIQNKILFEEGLSKGTYSVAQSPEYYIGLDKNFTKLSMKAQPLAELSKYNSQSVVRDIMTKYPEAVSFYPLKTNNKDMVVLMEKSGDEAVLSIVDLRPW
ncbi:TfpX/TfpZ family type IV pilin accessory protein [Neisseria yangbaofengii]|uniref:TfpX/TfpZ family type IV pilin accessory protein n=1 Tax=Neisseria yangbaofengii TaxID=2709396 RepID=UPI0013EC94E8|nr:TfpX/TfpZ family type IV pilin accessory protein [Neisseria yangbaofengii]